MTSEPVALNAASPFSAQVRWKIERISDARFDLVIWQAGQEEEASRPVRPSPGDFWSGDGELMTWNGSEWVPVTARTRFPMTAVELCSLLRGADRVISWSSPSAEGTFTQPFATPEEMREHLSIAGYIVISPGIEAHTKMVQAAPWANWVEEVPPPPGSNGIAWFADVFAGDDSQFRELARTHGVMLVESAYEGG